MVQIAVSGYYGCGNAGDEAVLAGMHEALAAASGGVAELTVLSQNPRATTALHGLPAVDRMNRTALRETLRCSDLLLSGGGSLLQDTTSLRSLLYYLWVIRLALRYRKPVMLYAQGIGPLHRPLSRKLTRLVLNRTTLITVRDPGSAQLLREIGVTRPPVEVTADPAFALSPAAAEKVEAAWAAESLPSAGCAAVSLRPWLGDREVMARYAQLLHELSQTTGLHLVLVPMHSGTDLSYAEEIAERSAIGSGVSVIRGEYAPAFLLGMVSRMQVVVGMRLHALIFAARACVPLFALSYDPKVSALMSGLNQSDAVADWRNFDPAEIGRSVNAILDCRQQRSAAIAAALPSLERAARRTAELGLALAVPD